MSKHNRPTQPQVRSFPQPQQGSEQDEEAFESAEAQSATTEAEGHADTGPSAPPKVDRPAAKTNGAIAQPRVYKGTQEIDHDLYKLSVATMRKNVSWEPKKPDIVRIEHVHIFHTVDSNGKKQNTCNQVGGHHHDIEVTHVNGGAPQIRVSEPRKYIRDEDGRKQSVPLNRAGDRNGDFHIHEVEYLGSERIKIRETNIEYAKFQAAMTAVQSPKVEGVVSG